jgi:hypothetical protein
VCETREAESETNGGGVAVPVRHPFRPTVVPGVLESDAVLETQAFQHLPPSRLFRKKLQDSSSTFILLPLYYTVVGYCMRRSSTENV